MKEIVIDGIKFVPESSGINGIEDEKGNRLVVIRSYSAGVHFGYLKEKTTTEVTLLNSRRIWAWVGAASLSQLSQEGVLKPNDCKIAMIVPEITINGWIEIIPASEKCLQSISGVKEWKV